MAKHPAQFSVVPGSKLQKVIRTAKGDVCRSLHYSVDCAEFLGKALSARFSVATRIVTLGRNRCSLTAKVYSVQTEASVQAAESKSNCKMSGFDTAVSAVVRQLASASGGSTAYEVSPSDDCRAAQACNKRGMGLYNERKPELALTFFKRAIELDPSHPLAVYNAACMYALMVDVEGALAMMRVLEGIDDPEARRRLSKPRTDPDWDRIRADPRVQAWIDSH